MQLLSDVRGPSDDMSPLPPIVPDQQCVQIMTIIMDNLTGSVNTYDEVYTLTSHISHIARGRPMWVFLYYLYIICIIIKTFELYSLLYNILSLSFCVINIT